MKKKLLSVLLICTMTATLFAACGKKEEVVETPDEDAPVVEVVEEPAEEIVETTKEISFDETNDQGQVRSYLSGEWVNEEQGRRRPLAIMIENTKECLPQYAVSNASIIYECPVEGSITRMMALFENYDEFDRIGNVRSSRPYFVYFASEYEAIYAHAGGNPAAFELIDNGLVNNLNLLNFGTNVAYRANDSSAPHNLYTSGDGVKAGIKAKDYSTEYSYVNDGHFRFAAEEYTPEDGEDIEVVKMYYFYNHPWFEYNSEDGLYHRYEFGKSQIDATTGEQLTAKNIIIQDAEYWIYEGSQYLGFNVVATGSGKYLTNGKMIDVTWSKTGDNAVTRFYDKNGDEIKLNIGQTWVLLSQTEFSEKTSFYKTIADFKAEN